MIIAIDIGSKKTTIAKINSSNKILKTVNFKTPNSAQNCLELIITTISKDFQGTRFSKIIIGIPGVVKNNIVSWCSNLDQDWINFDLARELKKVFNVEVLLENDANLAGIFETRILAQVPKNAIYLNIGAGIGSAFVLNGKLRPELLHSEAGMTMLEYDGVVREWEEFASGKAISETYNCLAKDIKKPAIWESISYRFSRGLLMLIPIIQPDVIIIGGVMGKYFKKYQTFLNDIIDEQLPEQIIRPKIIGAKEPDLAVIYGCALYAQDK